MLGVDRLDQRMAYYQFVRKSVRWWRKVFFWMIEVVVVNSYILYTTHTDARRKLSHKEFRRELVMALCEEQRSTIAHRPRRQRRDQTLERLRGSHYPNTGAVRRDCRMCAVSEVRGVNDISQVPSAAHVAITPTDALGNAFVSTTHKLTCNYITPLNTYMNNTHPHSPADSSTPQVGISAKHTLITLCMLPSASCTGYFVHESNSVHG